MRKILFFISSFLVFGCSNVESASNSKDGHLYLRTYMWTGMYGSNLDISWIYLSKDGKIVRNPKHGADPVDWNREKEDNENNTGTYAEKNGKLEITWNSGKVNSWSIERKDGKITIIDGGIISEPDAMPKDYLIEGQYAASTVLPNVANSHTLIFKKDGTFSLTNLGTVTTPDVSKSAESSQVGNYNISGNTLTFNFSNGEIKKSIICIWEMGDKKNLVINGEYYPQEK